MPISTHRGVSTHTRFVKLLFSLAVGVALCCAVSPYAGKPDLTGLSIEELMTVKVTSLSKKVQNLSDSATAIFVITNDDLRRSGVSPTFPMPCAWYQAWRHDQFFHERGTVAF